MKSACRQSLPVYVGLLALSGALSICQAQTASGAPAPAEAGPPAAEAVPAPVAAPTTVVPAARNPAPAASAAPVRALKPAAAVPTVPPKTWNELSPAEQQALKPLAASWSSIDEAQKRKWLAMSRNFSSMTPVEQAKLHGRMNEWAALSPKQRAQARLNFAEAAQVPAEEKKATWQAYQALSPEEKRKLAAGAPAQPSGGATALKPVPASKLATPPHASPPRSGASSPVGVASAASAPRPIDQKTLLPRKPASAP